MTHSMILIAAAALPHGSMPLTIIAGVVAAVLLIIFFAIGYCKAPPDKAFIISGLR